MIIESASTNIVFRTLALACTVHKHVLDSVFNIPLLGQTLACSIRSVTKYQPTDIFRTGVRDSINHLPRRAREIVCRANVA